MSIFHTRPSLRALAASAALLCCGALSALAIPAFPGAEGAGGNAKGGRGGDVYHVTNTNSSGAGSLANGIATIPSAGRTIVFDVSGYAHIGGTLRVVGSKLTIAGQTAPGDGFGVKDGTFLVSGDDIVIRHFRFRDGNSADSINLDSGSINSIFDHCDAMFSNDENMSSFKSAPENMTYQWGMNAWGMESHSCGGLWDQNHATCHHTLWAHNHTRNPKGRTLLLDWVNNVTFDWDIGFILGDSATPANWNTNVMGSYFIGGTSKSTALEKGARDRNGDWNFHVYINPTTATTAPFHNLFDGNADHVLDQGTMGWSRVSGDVEHLTAPLVNAGIPVTQDHPLTAYKKIVSAAGPLRLDSDVSKPLRDEVDALLITELVAQTHHHVSSVAGTGLPNGGYGNLNSASAPTDTDQDGMPDYYETALGWSAAAQDHNTALANSGGLITGTTFFPAGTVAGYTRLEEYLHFLAIPHGVVAKNITGTPTNIVVDLRKFTSGFASTPTFTVANVSGGALVLSGTGNAIATFTPTLNFVGRGRFDFTVTDSAGSAWTQTCALVVSSNALPRDLKWKGDGALNNWDSTAPNWLRNGAATAFGGGDFATFDDTGSKSPAVSIAGASTGGIVVDAAGSYTFSGIGALSGALTKRGVGTLTISNTGTNTLSPAIIEQGALAIPSGSGLGAGTLTMSGGALTLGISPATAIAFAGDATVNVTGSQTLSGTITGAGTLGIGITGGSTVTLSGSLSGFGGTISLGASSGFLRLNSSSTAFTGSASATFDLGTGTTTLNNRNGNLTIDLGALRGGASTTLSGAGSLSNATTYSIGANGADTTFAGTIANGGTGSTAITKVGAGTLTLTGANTYTGATILSAGGLAVNGSLASATTVASGATLRGSGTYSGAITVLSGAKISPGAASGQIGTLTAAGGLTATSTTFSLQLSSSPAGVNDKISITGVSGTVSGTNTFDIAFADGVLGAGNYKLIECAAGIPLGIGSGMVMNLTTDAPAGTRQTFALNRTASGTAAGYIQLTVTGNTANLVWVGALNAATWDVNTTANFTGATPGTFYNFDSLTFDDTSANRTVTLTGSLAPRIVTVNTTLGYTLGGAGVLDGTGALVKTGTGTLTFAPISLSLATTTTSDSITATVASTAGLYPGMSVIGTGIQNATTLSAIVNATTLTLSQAATVTGTNTLSFTGANTLAGGITLNAGTISLANDAANGGALGTGTVTLNGGTISMHDDSASYNNFYANLVVPTGATARLNADSRVDMYGTLSGAGTLNFYVPYVRTDQFTDWSAFTGVINVLTDAGGGDFRMASSYSFPGFPQAAVFLSDKVWAYYTGTLDGGAGTTIEIGELSGTALSVLEGGSTGGRNFTYRIGGRNTNATFAGNIQEQNTGTTTSYVKTGTGVWTLSGTGNWNGGTTVEEGTLKITGAVTCASATNVLSAATLQFAGGSLATDALDIASNALLTGNGTISGDLNNDGTVLATTGGTLAVTGDVVNNGTMRIATGTALSATGAFVNNGVLDLLTSSSGLPPNLENNGVVIDSTGLRVLAVSKSGSSFSVTVQGYIGHTYQLQQAASLAAAWGNVGAAQLGTDSGSSPTAITPLTFTDATGAAGTQRYYRIAVTP